MSPVIATILMVAITVVLAATVYFWLTGFGSNQPDAVSASYTGQAFDLAGGDGDSAPDSLQITLVQGQTVFALGEISIVLDGAASFSPDGAGGAVPAGWDITDDTLADTEWNAGDGIFLSPAAGTCQVGVHTLVISARGAVIYSAEIEIQDPLVDADCP